MRKCCPSLPGLSCELDPSILNFIFQGPLLHTRDDNAGSDKVSRTIFVWGHCGGNLYDWDLNICVYFHDAYIKYHLECCKNRGVGVGWGGVKNTYELLNLGAHKFLLKIKCTSFNIWARYFVWTFKGSLWNSTQNILPIYWKRRFSFSVGNLRAPRCTSSKVFLNPPPMW